MINQRDYRIDGLDEEDDSGDWIVTFADLMALLLTFFVLLLSFSELNVQKYQELRERFNDAFSTEPLTSSSIVLAPKTVDKLPESIPAIVDLQPAAATRSEQQTQEQAKQEQAREQAAIDAWNREAESLVTALSSDIQQGTLEVLNTDDQIIIRIKEEAVFDSGSADVSPDFDHTLERIADSILNIDAKVKVAGHTDNQPIASSRFRSNWELSSARAVTVAHYLMEPENTDPTRFEVSGFADTRSLMTNDTEEGRAVNRRVEILLSRTGAEDVSHR